MKTQQRTVRMGAALLLMAVFIRLAGSGFFTSVAEFFTGTAFPSILLFLETGRIFTVTPQETQPEDPIEEEFDLPVFSPVQADTIRITNYPGFQIDAGALLTKPLDWNLKGSQPTVLILHTHTCESYKNTENYESAGDHRTLDERYNMLSIGAFLAQELESRGITALHDTTLYDYPEYDGAYGRSWSRAAEYLEQYPSIQLVLDIHRDAYADANGNQYSNTVTFEGTTYSKVMFLMGSNGLGDDHPNWPDNLAAALKLQVLLEQLCPGITRPICLRRSSYYQQISPGAMLIEIGTAGDTRQQALAAAGLLAQAISQLSYGSG